MLTDATSFEQPLWCTLSWSVSPFPNEGYNGPQSARVSCCMKGEYFDDVCKKCKPGFYQDSDHTLVKACCPCPRDGIAPVNGSISCFICATGKFSNDGIDCVTCPSGYYKDYIAHSNCTKCAVGRFQPNEGQSDCKDCQKGSYQGQKAKQFCISCNPGKYASSVRSSGCYACQEGRYQPGAGKSGCINITNGYEGIGGNPSLENPGHMAQIPCSAGKFSSTEGAHASSTCEPCKKGRYQSLDGKPTCHACPAGYGNENNGSAICIATPPG